MFQDFTEDRQLAPYFPFPRFLLDMPLSETAKILYVVLLDRARLSLKNPGWQDEKGRTFQYFTIADMAKVLHKSGMTAKTCLAELEKAKLLERKRQGLGQPNRLYVKVPSMAENGLAEGQKTVYPEGQQTVCQRDRNLSVQRDRKLSTNKTTKSKTIEPNRGFPDYECKEYESL